MHEGLAAGEVVLLHAPSLGAREPLLDLGEREELEAPVVGGTADETVDAPQVADRPRHLEPQRVQMVEPHQGRLGRGRGPVRRRVDPERAVGASLRIDRQCRSGHGTNLCGFPVPGLSVVGPPPRAVDPTAWAAPRATVPARWAGRDAQRAGRRPLRPGAGLLPQAGPPPPVPTPRSGRGRAWDRGAPTARRRRCAAPAPNGAASVPVAECR